MKLNKRLQLANIINDPKKFYKALGMSKDEATLKILKYIEKNDYQIIIPIYLFDVFDTAYFDVIEDLLEEMRKEGLISMTRTPVYEIESKAAKRMAELKKQINKQRRHARRGGIKRIK